jgi:hypothetical protein
MKLRYFDGPFLGKSPKRRGPVRSIEGEGAPKFEKISNHGKAVAIKMVGIVRRRSDIFVWGKEMSDSRNKAFTRADLIVCASLILVLFALGVYGVGSSKARALQVVCANNLRMVGQALHRWAAENQEQHPWWVAYTNGGVRFQPNGFQNNVYYNFAALSNELASPKLLVCPSDPAVKVAKEFSNNPQGGFLHLSYQNNAVSYFVGLHALPEHGWSWLAGDRHVSGLRSPMACTVGVTAARGWEQGYTLVPAWTNTIHQWTGNILLNGGAVLQLTTPEMTNSLGLQTRIGPYEPVHILSR